MPARLPRPQRREQVLHAATRAFARTGYFGTSTAAIAKQSGISQGYVIHLFGSKEALFLECLKSAGDASLAQLRAIDRPGVTDEGAAPRYDETALEEQGLLILQQGFAASSVPAVGAYVRELLAETYQLLVDLAETTPEQARDYLARGVLVNIVLAIGYRDHVDEHPRAKPLIDAVLGGLPPGITLTER